MPPMRQLHLEEIQASRQQVEVIDIQEQEETDKFTETVTHCPHNTSRNSGPPIPYGPYSLGAARV